MFIEAQDGINKLYNLSEDVREIVLKSPGGHPMPDHQFELTIEQADQVKALASLDDDMRSHLESIIQERDCNLNTRDSFQVENEKLKLTSKVKNRDFGINALVITSDLKYEQRARERFSNDDYFNFIWTSFKNGKKGSSEIFSIDLLVDKFKKKHSKIKFDNLDFSQKEILLNTYAESLLETKIPKGLIMKELAIQNLVNHPKDWESTLLAAKDKLTVDQKIDLISKLGGKFSDRYNYDRADAQLNAGGVYIKTEELLSSVQNGKPGGICRDIALAQTQMLNVLGFKHNYVVAYKTLTGSHATVITENPDTGKIVKFNYFEASEVKKGSGTESLVQDNLLPDHGLAFRIYNSDGTPVTRVPSELGQMLKDTAGGSSDRNFAPRNFSLTSVGFKTPLTDGSLFTGKTSLGESLYGVSLYKNKVINENVKIGIGASLSKLEGNKDSLKMEQTNLYLLVNSELTSPTKKIGPFETSTFVGGTAEVLIANTKEKSFYGNQDNEANSEIDGNVDFIMGVKAKAKLDDNKTDIDSSIYSTFYPDWNHVASIDRKTQVIDSFVVKSGVSHQITDDTKALIDTAVIVKNYGTSILIKTAYEDNKKNARYVAGVATPISKDMPTFLPGGEKRGFIGMEKFSARTFFSIMYERNFNNQTNNLNFKGEVKF
jgi:hypothetical protein